MIEEYLMKSDGQGMNIVFAGTPEVAVPSLQAIVDAGHRVTSVVTREDARIGRKGVLTPSPVAQRAGELELPILKANRLTDATMESLPGERPDLGVVVAYGGLIREPLLSYPKHGWINLHFSGLPKWRGAAPVQRALMAGERTLGVSVFRLVEELDAGRVVAVDTHEFAPGTPAGEVLGTLAMRGTHTLLDAIARITMDPAVGDEQIGESTYAHKLSRADGKLDMHLDAQSVLNHWSGVTPEPGAFALLDDQPVKVLELREATSPELADAGIASAGTARLVGKRAMLWTGDDSNRTPLVLERVQPAGRGAMDGAAWLRGRGGEVTLS